MKNETKYFKNHTAKYVVKQNTSGNWVYGERCMDGKVRDWVHFETEAEAIKAMRVDSKRHYGTNPRRCSNE